MLDWVAKLLPKNLTFSPSFTFNNIQNIKINSDNSSSESVTVESDTLVINDATKEGEALANKLIKQLPSKIKHDDLVLEDSTLAEYKEVDKLLATKSFRHQFNAFKGMIPKNDVPILEIAIVVKTKYDSGESVAVIKSQAVQRYGPRAGMICNLYNSGYFDTLIKPTFDSVTEGKMAIDEYLEIYEMIVTESPLAMFVGFGAPIASIKKQLLKKINTNKEEEVGYLNIHGIGDSNIRAIESLLADDEVKALFIEEPSIQLVGKSLKATVYI